MALKDWKQNRINVWEKHYSENSLDRIVLNKGVSGKWVVILYPKHFGGFKIIPDDSSFKTRTKALAFAKDYMRKH